MTVLAIDSGVDDRPARERILADLDTNFLVEAGAGSGKTTSLVGRMLAYVRRGTPVEQVAAVTFTRKAATELRERFELELERAIRETAAGGADAEVAERLARAREDLDRAFLGTIHSFCGRLLREHPLEAGLDPAFEEISEEAWPEIRRDFWSRWLERCRRAHDPALEELRTLGIDPRQLLTGFETVVRFPDVAFPLVDVAAPDVARCREKLRALLRTTRERMPAREPAAGWDSLQATVRRLEFRARTGDWSRTAAFCEVLATLSESGCKPTQNRWADDAAGKAAAKALGEEWAALLRDELVPVLTRWREHRYPPVMRFLLRAAAEFRRERLATGRLGFEDLLLGAAALLRESPRVRRALGERYRHLLVDEFQDTDPIQAEVCFLLASEPGEGDDWRTVVPRPGALFVVGDPKQSIYRFRRADIGTYELVKRRLQACGDVLHLVRNFRSVEAIGRLVAEHFEGEFPESASDVQAAYTPLLTQHADAPGDGVFRFLVQPAKNNQDEIVADCSARVASWIAGRLAAGGCAPGDFLVLGYNKWTLEAYARALAERNVPVSVTGAGLPQEHELKELIVVLRALADPANPVRVAAALEGLFFGLSPADLYEARAARLDFSIAHRPGETASPTGRALERLHEWWIAAQRSPVDALLERILDDTGLLVYAASVPLGENRAGTLLRLVEALRAAAADGGATLTRAIEAIEQLLAEASSDAPLRPGRTDAVRVMNLHKAKGLEARIVVLVAPVETAEHAPESHVRREATGAATGGLVIRADKQLVAQPPGWAAMEAEEARFLAAERERLRYVAVTRAKRELVVAQLHCRLKTKLAEDKSFWAPLAGALAACGERLELAPTDPPGRRALAVPAAEIARRGDEADARRAAAGAPTYVTTTVTASAKSDRASAHERGAGATGAGAGTSDGAAWGRAVHRVLEAVGRGRAGASLEAFARAVALDERLADAADETGAVPRLLRVVERLRSSDAWARVAAADAAHFELAVMRAVECDGRVQVLEGVADAVVRTGDEWRVLDWKTDDVPDDVWAERRRTYEAQVARYAEIVAALTGVGATGEIVRVRG
ncbi:MAG TPA: UvrD-helicase domain-containing protein [Gemmatimonadales bacterium]|nr:UvrD-helicase domain-containing protein [Gemmatimonadales bacterium]